MPPFILVLALGCPCGLFPFKCPSLSNITRLIRKAVGQKLTAKTVPMKKLMEWLRTWALNCSVPVPMFPLNSHGFEYTSFNLSPKVSVSSSIKTGLMTVVLYSAYLSMPRPVLTLYALTHLILTAVLRAENHYTHSACTGLRQG